MLKDPKFKNDDDFLVRFMEETGDGKPKKLEVGVYTINHFNFNHLITKPKRLDDFDAGYPQFENGELHSYGVCDTPKQFLRKFRKVLENDPRTFCVAFTHVEKNPENAGNGGGWRWHKWGPYVGVGTPTTEYLDDEEKFEKGIYTFHIEQIDGPILKLEYSTGKLVPKEKS